MFNSCCMRTGVSFCERRLQSLNTSTPQILSPLRTESLPMNGKLLTRGIWMSAFRVCNSLQAIQHTSERKPDEPLPFTLTLCKGLSFLMKLMHGSYFVVPCIRQTNSRRGKKYLLHHAHLYAQAYAYLRVSCLSGWRSVKQKRVNFLWIKCWIWGLLRCLWWLWSELTIAMQYLITYSLRCDIG
jgi:hypothetical protein